MNLRSRSLWVTLGLLVIVGLVTALLRRQPIVGQGESRPNAEVQVDSREPHEQMEALLKLEREALSIATGKYQSKLAAEHIDRDPTLALALAAEASWRFSDVESDEVLRAAGDACHEVADLLGHNSAVVTIDYSPDGTQLVTASADQSAIIWNLGPGPLRGKSLPHQKALCLAKFSPDGGRILTTAEDGTAIIWDAATGEPTANLSGHTAAIHTASFDSTGQRVITGSSDKTARIWDAARGTQVALLGPHRGEVLDACFQRGTDAAVTACADGVARIWNVSSADERARLAGTSGAVVAVAVAPKGEWIAAVSESGGAGVFDARTGAKLRSLGDVRGFPICLRVSPDGSAIFLSSRGVAPRLVRPDTGAALAPLESPDGEILDAQFNASGSQIALACRDGSTRVHDVESGKIVARLRGHRGPAYSVRFNPNGGTIATASDDQSARIWCIEPASARRTFRRNTETIRALAFSDDDTIVSATTEKGIVIRFDRSTRLPLPQSSGERVEPPTSRRSPDQKCVLAPEPTGAIHILDAGDSSTKRILVGHEGVVRSASYSLGGDRIVSASDDTTAIIWSVETGERITTLAGHRGWVLDAQFSPNGALVATASADGTAAIWRAQDGFLLSRLKGHTRSVTAVAFNSSGSLVATASEDGTIRVWPVDAASDATKVLPRRLNRFEREELGLVDFEMLALKNLLLRGSIETAIHAVRGIYAEQHGPESARRICVFMDELVRPTATNAPSPAVLVAFARELVTLSKGGDLPTLTVLAKAIDLSGDCAESIAIEKRAIALCGGDAASALNMVLRPLLYHRIAVIRARMDARRQDDALRLAKVYFERAVTNAAFHADLYDRARRLIENENTVPGAPQLAVILARAAVLNMEPSSRNSVEYWRLLAQCQLEAGDVPNAINSQLEAIAASSAFPQVKRRLEAWLDPLRSAGWAIPERETPATQPAPSK